MGVETEAETGEYVGLPSTDWDRARREMDRRALIGGSAIILAIIAALVVIGSFLLKLS